MAPIRLPLEDDASFDWRTLADFVTDSLAAERADWPGGIGPESDGAG